MHAPATPHARPHPVVTRRRRREDLLLADLRRVLAGTGHLPLDLLGEGPVRDVGEAAERVDALARELVERMDGAGWQEGAVPSAVTSVLAASVPEAETVLLRAARTRR
ncbi:hypothetical protein EV188_103167 [Actinomycetospora succinea]|uniref:Uncharacterized protein n=1 Tax=Actinomycetospora succinea TaxID=663603 RepID=A0A4R6VDW1_9PSEU|nr:hypothetical protein EV188_103167 [Actinomycetospora succinea]